MPDQAEKLRQMMKERDKVVVSGNGNGPEAAIRADGELSQFVQQRYASWDAGIGADIESGKADFMSLEAYMLEKGEIDANQSGRQEMLEHLVNRYF